MGTLSFSQKVSLRFERFDLEADQFCSYDSLEIYDGPTDTEDPLLGQVYCGDNMPPDLTSSGPSLTVVFSTDDSVTATGFTVRSPYRN